MNKNLKMINVAACTPCLEIGNPKGNIEKIELFLEKYQYESDVFVFPELCITGYSCYDLFFQDILIDTACRELYRFVNYRYQLIKDKIIVLGLPMKKDGMLFDCVVYIYDGNILGFVPKTHLSIEESRWFTSANYRLNDEIYFMGKTYPFTPNLVLKEYNTELQIAIVIGNDFELPNNLCTQHCVNGANLILNLAANYKIVGDDFIKDCIRIDTKKNICGYVYVSASMEESTTDGVYSGEKVIVSNGCILKEENYEKDFCVATIDSEILNNHRHKNNYFSNKGNKAYQKVFFELRRNKNTIYEINPYPFIPNEENREKVCKEILDIQSIGLAQRMKKTGINKLILGVSGGLDSTLALLVAVEALKRNSLPMENLIGITMPGFGTTNRTLQNSIRLMELFGITQKEISIVPACLQHFKDIGHDKDNFDVTYENVQARERTQILMDIANKENALVVGTGDLSELILGWCTYNGDHMSMYAVNASIPKTLIRYIVLETSKQYISKKKTKEIGTILNDICCTPVSPELLPTDKDGNMVQTTEGSIGKYDLHDFFLYHMFENGFGPSKIYCLATYAFPNIKKETIKNTLSIFYKRFITQQFKRSCLPDGPKVFDISVSPRTGLKMPSDACYKMWLEEIEKL